MDSENKVIDENRRKKLSAKVTEIPLSVYSEVCTLLNIRRVDDWKDFRMLGEKVGLKRNATEVINQRSENPTDAVLKKWSIDPAATVGELMKLLTEMERMDVVGVLDDWMNKE